MRNSLVEKTTSVTPRPDPEADRDSVAHRKTVGIAGGGQLALMMLEAAPAVGLETVVLDPDPD